MTDKNHRPVIFLAFANDRDDTVNYLRNLPEEARQIREPIQRARRDGLCDLVELANATADEIFQVFQSPEYRDRIAIFHYGGHANGYQLLLESSDGSPAAADAGGLAAFLGQQQSLQLAFLNGCSTQQQVQGLLDASVSCVIATSRAIDDQVAMEFAKQFYQGLAGGASIRGAYCEAEASVQMKKGGNTRGLYFGEAEKQDHTSSDRWPWELFVRDGAEDVANWNLPGAVGDPLFGLPPVTEHDLPDSPFRHLNWFDQQHAEVFFGRGHQIRQLYDLVTSPGTAPIVLLYGQSGVGKSSMLAAGLIPRLEKSHKVRYLRRNQQTGLLETLRSTFVASGTSVAVTDSMHFSRDWLEVEHQLGMPLIVILDQVEEVITRPNTELPHELDDLLNELEAIFGNRQERPKGRLILSFRKEWLAEIEARLSERHLSRTKVFLERLGRLGVIEVVLGPTRSKRLQSQYGLTVEEGLAEIIADDLLADAESAIAPTLQILLTKMWAKATAANNEHPEFSQDLYQHLKRDGLLLKDFLEQQITEFQQRYPEAVNSGLVLDLLARHTTALGTADQCSAEQLEPAYSGLGADLKDLLQQSQDLHLLTMVTDHGPRSGHSTRLSHDTLAPLVRERFDVADHPGQRARRILLNRAVDWQDGKVGQPLDETDLSIVEHGQSGMRQWTADEKRLITASRSLRTARKRRSRLLGLAAMAAVGCIVFFGAVAFRQAQIARYNIVTADFLVAGSDSEQGQPAEALHWFWRAYDGASQSDPRRLNARNLIASWSRSLGTPLKHDNTVMALTFSPDNRLVLTGSLDGTARLWDAETGNPVGEALIHKRAVTAVAFGPKGLLMLTASNDKTVQQWDVETRQAQGKPLAHAAAVTFVAFTADGTQILTGCTDGTVNRWNAASGDAVGEPLQLPKDTLGVLAFHAVSQTLVTGHDDNSAQLRDGVKGDLLGQPLQHTGKVNAAVFSADGKQIVTGSSDNTARLWDVETGIQGGEPFQYTNTIVSLAFSTDGAMLLTGSGDNTARLWSVEERTRIGEPLRHEGTVAAVAFSPDGKRIATGSWDNTARLWDTSNPLYWDATTGEARGEPLPHNGPVSAVTFSADGQTAVTGSADGYVRIWSTSTRRMTGRPIEHTASILAVAVSSDGKTLLTGSQDKSARLWDIESGEQRGEPLLHTGAVFAVAFSSDGKRAVTGSEDNTARVWNVGSGKPQGLPLKHADAVRAVAFSPDNQRVLTGSDDATAQTWIASTGQAQGEALQHKERVNSVAFSPDGQTIVTGSDDNTAQLWEAATGAARGAVLQHNEPVNSVLFTPDGKTALTASDDNTARLWDIQTGLPRGESLRHRGPINSVAVSPDSQTVITGSEDKTARLWDAVTGQPRGEPLRHAGDVVVVAFSQDGRTVITGSEDKTARLWNVPPPARDEPRRLQLSVEVRTGYYADTHGVHRSLNQKQWLERKQELDEKGGPCEIRRWED